jgi:putative phage-type endonuclease
MGIVWVKDADHIGAFEPGSTEWHEARKNAIGGSDVGTVLGVNGWKSPITLWFEKRGVINDQVEPNMAMRLGTKLEAPILEIFKEEHPELEVFTTGTYASLVNSRFHANPDAIYLCADGSMGVLEIKFAANWWPEVPISYRKQVLWYMYVLGLRQAKIAVLNNSTYREFDIVWDQFEVDSMVQEVERFLQYLDDDVMPDWDGSDSTYETMRLVNTGMQDSEEELGTLGMYLSLAYDKFKEAEEHLNEMKSRTLNALGDAKHGVVEGVRIVSKQATRAGAPYLIMKGKK